jgi:polyisoprenoid-binding protein YceI
MSAAVQPFVGLYDLDRSHSSFQFAVTHLKVSTFRASFADIDARLAIGSDAVALEAQARVESVSIAEPAEFRDHVVWGADFFAATEHPLITFSSDAVELADDGGATVSGQLMIRGISRAVTARGTFRPPVEDPFGMHRVGLELRATIDRRDWDMDWQTPLPGGGDALGWAVEITVQLELIKSV